MKSTGRNRPPLTIAVAHSKGGVGKSTAAVILAKFLARHHRVALKDYDVSQHLTQLLTRLAPNGRSLTRRVNLLTWLHNESEQVGRGVG